MTSTTENISDNLSLKVSNSAFWVFSFQVLDNILGFIRLLILARLLTPKDFGLVGVAWLVMQIFNAFTQTGIHQVLIHKVSADKYLNTAWTFLLIRGIFLFGVIYILAPFLSAFFNSPASTAIIRVIGFTLAIDGLTNIGTVFFQKHFTFNKQFIQQISGNLVDFAVAIILALVLRNVWALVYGAVANSIVRMILSYILSSYKPKLEFNRNLFKELNDYGKWIAGSNFLQFIYSQGDDLLVGRILGTTSLGFYQLAYRISNLPATQITHLISTIMFPAYASVQKDKVRFSKIYFQVLQLISFLSFFIGTIIILFAYDFTLLFLGEKWIPKVPAMQLLTVWGVLRSIGATTGPIWKSMGVPKILTYIQLIQVIILVLTIYPLTILWGITGTSIAVVISALIPNFVAFIEVSKSINLETRVMLSEMSKPLGGSLLVSLVYYLVTIYFIQEINLIFFSLLIVISMLTYLSYSIILHRRFNYSLYKNIFTLLRKSNTNHRLHNMITKLESLIS